MQRVLLVAGDQNTAHRVFWILLRAGLNVSFFASVEETSEVTERYDLAVVEAELVDGRGEELAASLLARELCARVVLLAEHLAPERGSVAAALGTVISPRAPAETLLRAVRAARVPASRVPPLHMERERRGNGGGFSR